MQSSCKKGSVKKCFRAGGVAQAVEHQKEKEKKCLS
jgi:hypothetical protein